jgi:hypothetical protein
VQIVRLLRSFSCCCTAPAFSRAIKFCNSWILNEAMWNRCNECRQRCIIERVFLAGSDVETCGVCYKI